MKRPRIITIICIIGYLTMLFSFPQVFSPAIKKLGLFVPAIYGVLVAAQFIAYVGLWFFKQWGVQLYLITFFARMLFFILSGQHGALVYAGAVVSVLFVIPMLKYYRQMDTNL